MFRRKTASYMGDILTHTTHAVLQPRAQVVRRIPTSHGMRFAVTSGQHVPTRSFSTNNIKSFGKPPHRQQNTKGKHWRMPMFKNLNRVSDVLDIYKSNGSRMIPKDISLCWNRIATIVSSSSKERNELRKRSRDIQRLLVRTMKDIDSFDPAPLASSIHGLAKMSDACRYKIDRKVWDDLEHRTILVLDDMSPREISNITWAFAKARHTTNALFDMVAQASVPKIRMFNPQDLSNMALAYAIVGLSSPVLFDAIADASLNRLDTFKPQALSNMAWAFATVGHPTPKLFDAIAEAAASRINSFKPQQLSNTAWAYATMEHSAPLLFDAISNAAATRIESFDPQALSNTAWAFATVCHSAPVLFDAIADSAVTRLDTFDAQAIANTAWAYATMNHSAPLLFDAIAEESVSRLDSFNPQNLANTAWAFATFRYSAPSLFDAIAAQAISRLDDFSPQNLANTVWAYATAGHSAPSLFHAVAEAAVSKLDKFTTQNLANMVWAYAVCDQFSEILLGDQSPYIKAFNPKASYLSAQHLSQLHQVHLWCLEHGRSLPLDCGLQQKCRDAFVEQQGNPSKLQKDVIKTLSDLGLDPKEEFRMGIGYSLDAVVRYRNRDVAVEVDGPSHFLSDRSPTGSTILKHRQLARLENYSVVSVPYWKWNAVAKRGTNSESVRELRKKYLLEILDQATVKT